MTTNAPALADVIQRAQHETLGIPIEPAAAVLAARWTLPAAGGDTEAPRGLVLGFQYVFGEVLDCRAVALRWSAPGGRSARPRRSTCCS